MNKIFKTILISSIAIFSAGFLAVLPVNATPVPVVDPLVVEYSTDGGSIWLPLTGPIFNETNFLPGNGVVRLIRVTNNSGETQRIATESINENNPDGLASQLNLTIKENTTTIFDNTLAQFFSQGETYLSSLSNATQTQYDFTITFNAGADDDYQGKTLGFDILVGFEGMEGGLPLPAPGGGTSGGGDGGYLPEGLTITNETSSTVQDTYVTITWTTSYSSTSYVVYGTASESHVLNLSDASGTPPKYGYEHATTEIDTSPKVTFHTVTILGLLPNTTYYYRAVSHGSLAISQERSFTTLTTTTKEVIEGEIPFLFSEVTPSEQEQSSQTGGTISTEEEGTQGSYEETSGEELTTEEKQPITGLLAAIDSIPFNFRIILIIFGIIISGLIILQLTKKKEIKS